MEATNLTCQLSVLAKQPKTYAVKQILHKSLIPKSARYIDTIYINNYAQDIYKTPNNIFYATNPKY